VNEQFLTAMGCTEKKEHSKTKLLAELVAEFRKRERTYPQTEMDSFKGLEIEDAIKIAARAREGKGVRPDGREINLFFFSAMVALVGFFFAAQRCQSQGTYTVSDYGGWSGSEVTGFGTSDGGDETVGQTFFINNVNALVDSISVPVYAGTSVEFQIGVAAWNGSQATGSLLYLSAPLLGDGDLRQTCTVTPSDLTLSKGQEYILFLTPNNFVNSSPTYSAGVGSVPSDEYSGGQYFEVIGYQLSVDDLFTHSWSAVPVNMAFSVNYQVAPVREPPTLTLLCLCSLALCLRYRGQIYTVIFRSHIKTF
jgi:hypothetical protein